MSREVPDSARAGDSRSARSPGLHRRDGAGFCCLFHRPAATARAIDLDIPESDVPEKRGEIHVKAGYLNGSPYYAVKIVSGFASNLQRGLPPNDGMVVVFDAIPAPSRVRPRQWIYHRLPNRGRGRGRRETSCAREHCRNRGSRYRCPGAISGGNARSGEKLRRGSYLGTRLRKRHKPAPSGKEIRHVLPTGPVAVPPREPASGRSAG